MTSDKKRKRKEVSSMFSKQCLGDFGGTLLVSRQTLRYGSRYFHKNEKKLTKKDTHKKRNKIDDSTALATSY
jgi:hypothetical protein